MDKSFFYEKTFQVKVWPISWLNDSETQEWWLDGKKKEKRFHEGYMPPFPLETYTFQAHLGKRSVHVYSDPRLNHVTRRPWWSTKQEFSSQRRGNSFVLVKQHGRSDISYKPAIVYCETSHSGPCLVPKSFLRFSAVVSAQEGDVTRDDSQRRFVAQHSVPTLLRHCFEWLQHCSSIATLSCAENRRCESSRVTSHSGGGGVHLDIFWVGMCRPGIQIGTPS